MRFSDGSPPSDLGRMRGEFSVLPLGLLQDRDIRVGILPEGEEIFVGGERADAGSICIRALGSLRLQSVGSRYPQVRQCSRPAAPRDAAVVENFLKLGGGSASLSGGQVGL